MFYLDLIFLLNWFIDLIVLAASARIRRLTPPRWRLALSAAIGALYVVFIFFPPLSFLYTFAVKFLFSIVMIVTAFGFCGLQQFLKNLGVFYCVNFAAAGAVLGLHYFIQSPGQVFNGILTTRSGMWTHPLQASLVLIIPALLFALWLLFRMQADRERHEQLKMYLAEVQVWIGSDRIVCPGLVDTGNRLYDPLSGMPVLVMQASRWQGKLPGTWLERIRKDQTEQLISEIDHVPDEWRDRIRFVPYRGIHSGSRFMVAVRPDKVVITGLEQGDCETDRILIGLGGGSLSSDGSYEAMIHPALVDAAQANQSREGNYAEA